jgi:formylglycine-generating enzyme required for sulfatase activity
MSADVTTAELPLFADVPAGTLPGAAPTVGFRLAVVPTTVAQYWSYLVDQDLHRATSPLLHGFPATSGTGLRSTATGAVEFDRDLAELPVTGVTWVGAMAYCAWLGDRIGTPCRLPTVAEWHYAAAGGSRGLRWSLGDDFDRKTYAPAASLPRPVGATPANTFGLRDMTGNVFEWCADPVTAPESAGGGALGSRMIKGGAYTVRNPESFENATVFSADELSAVPYIGFRVLGDTADG